MKAHSMKATISYKDDDTEVSLVRHQEDTTLVALLKNCTKQKDLVQGCKLNAHILKWGLLNKSIFVGSALTALYAKCGYFGKARQVLDGLMDQNVVSWNALIAGYVQHGREEEAMDCFKTMKHNGISPDAVSFGCILKACSTIKAVDKGKEIHNEVERKGMLGSDIVVANALVDMYARCGAVAKAQQVIDQLSMRSVVAWTALITGYCQHGHTVDALKCFEQMQSEGLSPNTITFACTLRACSSIRELDKGIKIHVEIVRKKLLEASSILGTALVDMYAKCGALSKAQEVFDGVPGPDVVAWTALIAGYAQHGFGKQALDCHRKMIHEGFSPNSVTFTSILKACGSTRALDCGVSVHARIIREGLLCLDNVLGNALIDMYVKCHSLLKAKQLFEELPLRDELSWTTLIVGYCQCGHGEEAVNCYGQMIIEGLTPDATTFLCVLQACGSVRAVEKGKEVHNEILRDSSLREDSVIGAALVDMYAKCGAVVYAREVFDELSHRSMVSWNALLTGYCQHGHTKKALTCMEQMKSEGISPDTVTLLCGLQACGSTRATEQGKAFHAQISGEGLLEKNIELGNALVDMYLNCGAVAKAEEVFDELYDHDVVSWNVLIAGYCQNGLGEEALNCLEVMQCEGLSPDPATLSSALKACTNLGAAWRGRALHDKIIKDRILEKDSVLGNALVDMYAQCDALAQAKQVFDELQVRDTLSWTALISGYCEQGHVEEALDLICVMQCKELSLDVVTFACFLKTCGSIGAANIGKGTHAEISRRGMIEQDDLLGSVLVDMYSKCGVLASAQEVFDDLSAPNVVSWTALIAGYAHARKHEIVFSSLNRMRKEGIEPNFVTFIVVLKVCSQHGLIDAGQMYFESMSLSFRVSPTPKHYSCMVNLFACTGYLHKGLSVIEKLPPSNHNWAFSVLLGACKKWGDVELGRLSFDQSIGVEEACAVA